MTIQEAQVQVDQWIKNVGVRYFSELTNTTILMEEVGEFARIMARVYGEQSFKNEKSEAQIKQEIGEELADILFVVLCLANQTDTDLKAHFDRKMEIKTQRDQERHMNNPKLK